MTTISSNSRTQRQVTVDEIQHRISKITEYNVLSKTYVHRALAECFLAWADCCAPNAPSELRAWIKGRFEKRSEENKVFNDHVAHRQNLASDYKAKKSGVATAEGAPPNGAEVNRPLADEERHLMADAAMTELDWKNLRKSRLIFREDDDNFISFVKYVFNLDSSVQASNAGRYARVLAATKKHFGAEAIQSADDIMDFLEISGGIESIINSERGNPKADKFGEKPEDPETLKSRETLLLEASSKKFQVALTEATPLASTKFDFAGTSQVALALCRIANGNLEIVSTCEATTDILDWAMLRFNTTLLPAMEPNAAFLSRLLPLAFLIAQGRQTNLTDAVGPAGDFAKETRVLSILPATDGPVLVLSARYARSSVIIHAHPRHKEISIHDPKLAMTMDTQDFQLLDKRLSKPRDRYFSRIEATEDEGETAQGDEHATYTWFIENDVLREAALPGGREKLRWVDVASQRHRPLTVDRFSPHDTVNVTAAELEKLYRESQLANCSDSKPGKVNKPATLIFEKSTITYGFEGLADFSIVCTGKFASPTSMSFRPQHLRDLLRQLQATGEQEFSISIDEGGMLRVSWVDEFAKYEIYHPTIDSDDRLETSRVAYLR